jgi:hypothetical protein
MPAANRLLRGKMPGASPLRLCPGTIHRYQQREPDFLCLELFFFELLCLELPCFLEPVPDLPQPPPAPYTWVSSSLVRSRIFLVLQKRRPQFFESGDVFGRLDTEI